MRFDTVAGAVMPSLSMAGKLIQVACYLIVFAVLGVIFIALFGLFTLGFGWMLFCLVSPLTAIWAILYYGLSIGGPHSATVGMRMMDLQLRTFAGERGYFLLGAAHAVFYWISVSVLTPFIVLVGLFNRRKQPLHDLVLGTVIINRSAGSDHF